MIFKGFGTPGRSPDGPDSKRYDFLNKKQWFLKDLAIPAGPGPAGRPADPTRPVRPAGRPPVPHLYIYKLPINSPMAALLVSSK